MSSKKSEKMVDEAEQVSSSTEARQIVQQIVEEARHVLQTAKEKATTIEAEGKQMAQEIIEEAKKMSRAAAEQEAQQIVETAREAAQEETQGIIQRAREEAEREAQDIAQKAREEAEREAQDIAQKAREEAEEETLGIIQRAREEAEREAQDMMQRAGEEAQHITQTARAEAEAVTAKRNELIEFIKAIQDQILDLSEMAQQIVATHGTETAETLEEEITAMQPEQGAALYDEPRTQYAEAEEEGAAIHNGRDLLLEAIESEAQPTTEEFHPQYAEPEEETIVMQLEDGTTLYKGELELVLDPATEVSQLVAFQKQLQGFPEIKVLRTAGSRDEGGLIGIRLENPTPLLDMLREIPGVEEAMHEPAKARGKGFAFGLIRSKQRREQPLNKRILVSLESHSHD